MPTTYNGVGTAYWGKSNLEVRRDACEQCHTVGDLKSYDTTKYFVLLFLPLIPLGKLRILDHCPKCTNHKAIKLKEWQRMRHDSVREAVAAYEKSPHEAELALTAVQTCAFYQDREAFVGLAGKVLSSFGGDAEMVANVGSTLLFFGHFSEAEAAYRKSLAIDDDPEIRESLGIVLLRQGRPDDAWPQLEHLFRSEEASDIGALFLLVEGYQAEGRHDDALQIIDALVKAFPDLADNKELGKYRKQSRKHQRSGKRIVSAALAPAKATSGSDWGGRMALLVWPLLLMLIVAPLTWFAFRSARGHQVFLVNGLSERYAVRLAGETHHLPPGRGVPVRVAQRVDHVVEVAGDEPALEPLSFRLDLSLWESWWGEHTFVVNPDRLAVLHWQQVEYAETPDPERETPYELRAGEGFYSYQDVDYEFRDFPDEIELSSGSPRALREGLEVLADHDSLGLYWILAAEDEGDQALVYLKRLVELRPENENAMFVLAGVASAEDFTALAAPHLVVRPVEVEWHRAYQSVIDRGPAGDGLSAEYATLLAAEPDNSRLLYLASRIDLDPDKAEGLLRRAIELDPANAYAYNSLAYHKISAGEFAEALPLVEKARELEPEKASFQAIENDARLGLGHWQILLEQNRSQQDEQPLNGELVAREILLRSAKGEMESAAACVGGYLQRLASAEDAQDWDDPEDWQTYLEAMVSHGRGDLSAFGEGIGGLDGPANAFQSALARGAMRQAEAALTESEAFTTDNHLLIYLGAVRAGDSELAEGHLAAAIELLRQGDREQRALALGLMGEDVGVDFLRFSIDPGSKAITLAALAVGDLKRRGAYRRLARRLNFRLGFPRLYLAAMLSGS